MSKFLSTHQGVIVTFILPLFCFGFIFWAMPIADTFQFDSDEGQEMMKALLYARGFQLYSQIWSDQPPLFTFLLSHWLELFDNSILAARLLVLGFATLLIWCFGQILRLELGAIAGFIGVILLLFSVNFMRLSVSVMIGLPSLALAIASIYFLWVYAKSSRFLLFPILSGMMLALSLQLKMYTIFLFPLISFFWWQQRQKNSNKSFNHIFSFYPVAVWFLSLVITFLFVGFALNSLDLKHFFQFHLGNNVKTSFPNENSFLDVLTMYLQDLDYGILALFGIRKIGKTKDLFSKFPLLWLILATLILLNHKPIWYHHYLLLSIPLVWLATYGIMGIIRDFQERNWMQHLKQRNIRALFAPKYAAIALLFSLVAFPIKLSFIHLQNQQFLTQTQHHQEVLQNLVRYRKNTHWLFTDIPMYGAYGGIKIPPEIATLSRKRIASQEISNSFLEALFAKYQPEQCIIEKLPELEPPLDRYFSDYQKIQYDRHWTLHYIKTELIPKNPSVGTLNLTSLQSIN